MAEHTNVRPGVPSCHEWARRLQHWQPDVFVWGEAGAKVFTWIVQILCRQAQLCSEDHHLVQHTCPKHSSLETTYCICAWHS